MTVHGIGFSLLLSSPMLDFLLAVSDHLFLLLTEPRHLRGAQRRRGRGVGPGVWRGLQEEGAGASAGRVLNKCLWKRRGRWLPSARVLALMHCAPRAEEAAPAFSATAATARCSRPGCPRQHLTRSCRPPPPPRARSSRPAVEGEKRRSGSWALFSLC